MTYRWKIDILVTSVVTVVLAFIGIWLGTLDPVKHFFTAISGSTGSPLLFGSVTWAKMLWSLVVLAICYFGAVLPIWRWAQPTNYVAFWIVFLGILGGTVGLIIWHPAVDAVPAMKNVHVGTLVALILSLILIWTGFWTYIWILSGASNQLMAALALLPVSLWLMSKGKNYWWTFIPFIFMFVTTMGALARTGYKVLYDAVTKAGELPVDKIIGNYIAGILAIILFLAALYLAVDAFRAIQARLAEGRAAAAS